MGSTRHDSGGRIVSVSDVTVHPQYGQPQYSNDIAALRLVRSLDFNNNIRAIRLPQRGQAVPLLARLTVTGWGITAVGARRVPHFMMEAKVQRLLCRLTYGDLLTDQRFCAGRFFFGGVSSCHGDSGGAVVFGDTAFGIVSFGIKCAQPLAPAVFTKIAAFRNWITENTGV